MSELHNPDIIPFDASFERLTVPAVDVDHEINERGITIHQPLDGDRSIHFTPEDIQDLKLSIAIWEGKFGE